jgi:hypothetical protein
VQDTRELDRNAMLKLLKRWLGWEPQEDFYADFGSRARRPRSATAHLFAKPSAGTTARAAPRQKPKPRAAAPAKAPAKRPPAKAAKPAASAKRALPTRPKAAARPEFDPYNTGKFDRSASWERISKNQR